MPRRHYQFFATLVLIPCLGVTTFQLLMVFHLGMLRNQYWLTSEKVFDLKRYQPQGRLTLIRSINLKFAPNPSSTISLFDRTPEPKEALIVWTKDFFNSLLYDFRFPALQNLTLDFLEMKLDENEGLRVSAIYVLLVELLS